VILSGSVSVHKHEKLDEEDTVNLKEGPYAEVSVESVGCCVAVLVSGDTFGEVGIMSTTHSGSKRSATIITRGDTELCVIAGSSFLRVADRSPPKRRRSLLPLAAAGVGEEDQDAPPASPPPPSHVRRSSELIDLASIHFQPSLCKKALLKQVGKRSENEIMNIFRMVKTNSSFFGELADPLLKSICQVMELEEVPAESAVVVQHDPGETCFMILSGKVEIRIKFGDSNHVDENDSAGTNDIVEEMGDTALLEEEVAVAAREKKYGKLIGHMEMGECCGEKVILVYRLLHSNAGVATHVPLVHPHLGPSRECIQPHSFDYRS
jgi:CRP-like cAMP-binding protein